MIAAIEAGTQLHSEAGEIIAALHATNLRVGRSNRSGRAKCLYFINVLRVSGTWRLRLV
jgi:hypothetical protein